MALYPIHFSATPSESFPPLDTLPTIELQEQTPEAIVAALDKMLRGGFVSSNRDAQWARLVVTTHPDGKPKWVVRVRVEAAGEYEIQELN